MIDTNFKQGDSEWMLVRKILERLNNISSGGVPVAHNSLSNIQGGAPNDYQHLTTAEHDSVVAMGSVGNGLLAKTGAGTWASRTLTGTAGEISVANGDGVSANPTLSLPAALTFTGKTITGGSFVNGTFNGTIGTVTPGTAAFTSIFGSNISIVANQINEYATNALASIAVNYSSYSGGTTQFRNLDIYDGKNGAVASFDGSSKSLHVYGGINATSIGATTPSTGAFTRLGVGAATDGLFRLKIIHDEAVTECVSVQGTLTAPPATDLHAHAFRDATAFVSSVAADAYSSYDAVGQIGGTQNYNHYYGYQARGTFNSSGTLDQMAGFTAYLNTLTGTVTSMAGFLMFDPNVSSTVTNLYGVYINSLTEGTNNWGIYTDGTMPSFIGGNLLVGGSSATGLTGTGNIKTTGTVRGATLGIGADWDGLRQATIAGSSTTTNIAHIVATGATYAGTVLKIGCVDAAPAGNLFVLATGVNPDGTGGSATPMTISGGGNLAVSGSIQTGAPSGGTSQTWKCGNYTAGVAVQAGKVRVEINGTPYDLLTA